MNQFLLSRLVAELDALARGRSVGAVRWERPLLVVPLRGADGTDCLVWVLESPGPFAFLSPRDPLAGVAAKAAFPKLTGARVRAVAQPDDDRVMQLRCESDTEGALTLTGTLFGGAGGAVLAHDGRIVQSVGNRRDVRPRGGSRHPLSVVTASEMAGLRPTQTDVPGLDPVLAAVFATADGDFDSAALIAFRDGVRDGAAPFALAVGRRASRAVPVPVSPPGDAPTGEAAPAGPFATAIAACAHAGQRVVGDAFASWTAAHLRPVRKHKKSLEQLMGNLERDLEAAAGHETVRREAEALAAYQTRVRPGQSSVALPDPYAPDRTLTVALDPSQPVAAQVERRFRRAAKLEKSQAYAGRRLTAVKAELNELTAALEALDDRMARCRAEADLEAWARVRDDAAALAERVAPDGPQRAAGSADKAGRGPSTTGFRRYELNDRWFALVGRNDRENDALTFKHAAPTDLWFHAQHVAGSHVVLKSRGGGEAPPRTVIERTASIAAHFSKAKHSGLVPVIYTQRKYVRKFRGARPGQVVCEREKMVMVEPALPPVPGGD